MAIEDVDTPGSPGWWFRKLFGELRQARQEIEPLAGRMRGEGPLPEMPRDHIPAYREFQRRSRTNFEELIVGAKRQRMQLLGFRTAATDDEHGDQVARQIADGNDLDVKLADCLTSALGKRRGYMIVGKVDELTGVPLITEEDPLQVITSKDPATGRDRAGLKMWHDDDFDEDVAKVYLPGEVHTFRRTGKASARTFQPAAWTYDESESFKTPSTPDEIRVVSFEAPNGLAIYEPHLDLIDRIRDNVFSRQVIITLQAFRQRAVKGLPEVDDEGNEIDYTDVFRLAPGVLWQVPGDVEFWESEAADITPLNSAIKDDTKTLGSVTFTPLTVFDPAVAAGSAEGAALAREGGVASAWDLIRRVSSPLKRVMRLSLQEMGETERADWRGLEVMWEDPERRSLAERADAASKAGDMSPRMRMEKIWGFTPAEIQREEEIRALEQLFAVPSDLTSGTAS